MVKNKKGGSRHKKMARKNVSSNYDNIKLITSSSEFEQYARVTKLLGNGMAEVLCNDGNNRLLIIRGKFCGRNRRDNQINVDSLVLVGLREWEVVNKKKLPKVDLLYVYLKTQTDELKKLKNFNKKILPLELKEASVDFKSKYSEYKNLKINEEDEENKDNEDNEYNESNDQNNYKITENKYNKSNKCSKTNTSIKELDFNIDDI